MFFDLEGEDEIRERAREADDLSLFDPVAPTASLPDMTAPFVRGSDTSAAAAEQIEPRLKTLCRAVLDYVRAQGVIGATVDEIEVDLELLHQTAGARMRELVLRGFIEDSEQRRPTRSGRSAVVWIAKGLEPPDMPRDHAGYAENE